MGLEKTKKNGRTQDTLLWRRFSQVEKLPAPKRRQIVQIIACFRIPFPAGKSKYGFSRHS